ncbi:hypothetical protein [uncultured Tenacibaculum sp.]|uniref:hypothetical protein n=1 Tax=uncultured Tenacibaculum sp. TaxID=174713 RepID=UPI002623CF53|nr:hypothetical protein [uncultured Tenacibaculum sp.]
MKKKLNDSTKFGIQYGCVGWEARVNDYFINSYFSRTLNYKLKEKEELDSLVIFNSNLTTNYKNKLLEKIKPKPKFYNKIRELALQNNYSAVIALSKFKKNKDVFIINSLLKNKEKSIQYFGLVAVKNFPNKAFFKNIINIHQKEINIPGYNYQHTKALYKAIVSYKTPESRKLLEKSINKIRESKDHKHKGHIWKTLKAKPDYMYKGLIEQMEFSKYELMSLKYELHSYNSTIFDTIVNNYLFSL